MTLIEKKKPQAVLRSKIEKRPGPGRASKQHQGEVANKDALIRPRRRQNTHRHLTRREPDNPLILGFDGCRSLKVRELMTANF